MDKSKPEKTSYIDPKSIGTSASSPSSVDADTLLKFIERRHPEYLAKSTHWSFLDSCYEGGRDWFTPDNIFRYLKEGDEEYKDRLKRAYRFNHTREVVDLVNKYLFKQNITRNEKDAPSSVKEFWNSASKNGLGINDLARQFSLRSSIQGRVGIVIDNNAKGKEVITQADQKEKGIRTYGYIVRCEQILDLAWDEAGRLEWIKIAEVKRDDSDPITSSGKEKEQYRLWTKNSWKLFEIEKEGRKRVVKIVDEGDHDLGMVPVVLVDNVITDHKYAPPALVDDIAYLDRAVTNYLSNLDAIIQDQTFSQLVMPAQSLLPGEEAKDKVVEMGTKRVFLYDNGGGSPPGYISPDVKQSELLLAVIHKVINEIYHTVGLAGERTKQDNSLGIDNSSGVAKAYDFEKVNALLTAKAHSLEKAENEIASIVAKWNGETIKDNLVAYPDDFDTRGLFDEFEIAGRLALVSAPDAVRREQMRILVGKLFPQMTTDLRKAIESELKNWPPLDVIESGDGLDDDLKKPGNQGAVGPDTDNPN